MRDNQVVLNWILEQKMDETIEFIERDTLNEYITTKDFLAVIFCKYILKKLGKTVTANILHLYTFFRIFFKKF